MTGYGSNGRSRVAGHTNLDSKKPRARADRNPGLRIHSLTGREEEDPR